MIQQLEQLQDEGQGPQQAERQQLEKEQEKVHLQKQLSPASPLAIF